MLGALQDEVGAICFEQGQEKWIFELAPASDYEKMAVKVQAAPSR